MCGRQITLSKTDKICPLTIPNHSPLIYMGMQNFNEIHKEIFKLGSGNQALMDGQMDRHSEGKTYPSTTLWWGIKSPNQSISQSINMHDKSIQIKGSLFLHENICCGYSLEAPLEGTSNEYHNL